MLNYGGVGSGTYGGANAVIAGTAAITGGSIDGLSGVFRTYNLGNSTATDYERGTVSWSGNSLTIGTEAGGAGVSRAMVLSISGNNSIFFNTNGSGRWSIDGATGALTSSGVSSALGYGRGGSITQATSKSTAVTLNAATGQITLNNASLAASTSVAFTLTNSVIGANDLVLLNHVSAGTAGAYSFCSTPAAGSTVITVRNLTAGALAEAIVIQYSVIKGAIA